MLIDISHTIIDFVVFVTRLTTEELSDEQRMVLIDQFINRIQVINCGNCGGGGQTSLSGGE